MKNICQKEETLADYLEGRLSDTDKAWVETHLSDCDACRAEIIIGSGLVRGGGADLADAPADVTESAVHLVKALAAPPTPSLTEKAGSLAHRFHAILAEIFDISAWRERRYAPLRGSRQMVSKDLMRLKKSFKAVDVEIEIEKTGENNSHIRVRLPHNLKGIRVTLLQDDREREISSQLLDGAGAVFEELPFGHYSLIFTRDGQKLGIYRFVTKETGYAGR